MSKGMPGPEGSPVASIGHRVRGYWPKEPRLYGPHEYSPMKTLLAIASAGEAVTGLVLMVYPPMIIKLLFDAEASGAGIMMSRVAGIALVALGLACYPSAMPGSISPALRGMLAYNLLVTLYLGWLGIGGQWMGRLLWPAVAVHAILTVLLVGSRYRAPGKPATKAAD